MCAIKRISPLSKTTLDTKHILREIRLMRWLGARHENILTLKDLYLHPGHDEIYLVLPLFDTDLHRVIQSKQKLSPAHVAHFMKQILRGIDFIHRAGVLHRDLKPGNLLVNRDCHLVLADFGLARVKEARENRPMTHHVVTRWYRPPELILNPDGIYGTAVDVWSVGCIFAELMGRKPLFPGKDQVDQLTLIFQCLGSPDRSQIGHIRNSDGRRFLNSLPWYPQKKFCDIFKKASDDAIELLDAFLKFEPDSRISVQKALNHSYFSSSSSNKKFTKQEGVVSPPSPEYMNFESGAMSRDELLGMVTEEIRYFRALRRGIRNLDKNVATQRKRSTRGVVNDLRSKAAAARTAIVPVMSKKDDVQEEKVAVAVKPPLRPKVVDVDEKHPTVTPPPPRDLPPPRKEEFATTATTTTTTKQKGSLSPSARELRRISKSFKSGAIDMKEKRALKKRFIRDRVTHHHSDVQDEKVSEENDSSSKKIRRGMMMMKMNQEHQKKKKSKKKVTVARPFRFATAARRSRRHGSSSSGRNVNVAKKEKRKDEKETKVETTAEVKRVFERPPIIPRPTTGDSKALFDDDDDIGSSGDYTEIN